jgi:hypothetical protein
VPLLLLLLLVSFSIQIFDIYSFIVFDRTDWLRYASSTHRMILTMWYGSVMGRVIQFYCGVACVVVASFHYDPYRVSWSSSSGRPSWIPRRWLNPLIWSSHWLSSADRTACIWTASMIYGV